MRLLGFDRYEYSTRVSVHMGLNPIYEERGRHHYCGRDWSESLPLENNLKELKEMSIGHILQTSFEAIAIILLVVGFIFEDKVIDFEMAVRRIVLGNYRRHKRLKGQKKANS